MSEQTERVLLMVIAHIKALPPENFSKERIEANIADAILKKDPTVLLGEGAQQLFQETKQECNTGVALSSTIDPASKGIG